MINGVAVVSAPAEIDIVNAEQLRTVLREASRPGHATVVVDMTGTRFCDSEGFSVLVGAQKWALAEGGGLRVVIPAGSPVLRVFRVIGLGRFIPRFASLEQALTQGLPPRARKYLCARPPSRVSPPDLLTEREKVRGRRAAERWPPHSPRRRRRPPSRRRCFIDQAVPWVVSKCGQLPGACR
jgi:anti-sigma B factor antagonist